MLKRRKAGIAVATFSAPRPRPCATHHPISQRLRCNNHYQVAVYFENRLRGLACAVYCIREAPRSSSLLKSGALGYGFQGCQATALYLRETISCMLAATKYSFFSAGKSFGLAASALS